jgi:hypothetical protein
MSREVLVRFIGRFALVQEANQLRVIAVDMTFNPALGIPEHHPSLVIDTQRVSSGREHAESTIVPPVASADDIVEYSRWALKGCELTFGGVEPTAAVTFTATNPIRSLASLHPGVRLNPAALDARPDGTAVAARVALSAGSVNAARQRKTDLSSYVFVARADTRVPDATRIAFFSSSSPHSPWINNLALPPRILQAKPAPRTLFRTQGRKTSPPSLSS